MQGYLSSEWPSTGELAVFFLEKSFFFHFCRFMLFKQHTKGTQRSLCDENRYDWSRRPAQRA